ncbi:GPW/gp25 family protein [Cellulomonas sp. S1-8]|uniref:GPW/gp25 family protein n=1 Tax=Cellulomonas sp. S1-8 TaxID=2904790 RepID=UPI0022438311|nr:GPW/gp25 family protein [Cellulomonas sp. S1-8]UZN02566.1 GPW/gp25 family protein [Cellulomonas sp. S1-8]
MTGHAFVGTGWHWPVETDATGAFALTSGSTLLEQAMYLILSTTPGERPMRPEFGAQLRQFVFESGDATTAGRIATEVRAALLRWEPRVDVGEVAVTIDPDDASTLWIDVAYRVRSTNDRRNLVFPFYVIGRHEEADEALPASSSNGHGTLPTTLPSVPPPAPALARRSS